MLNVNEGDIDRITEVFYLILKGQIPEPVALPDDYPDNEIKQVVGYVNRFIAEYRVFAGLMSSLSRGEVDFEPPKGTLHVLQSFKHLHANLRHLTWKTQQIAGGDLAQEVDFMGEFSKAFNSMTGQLRDAFAKIEQRNQMLSQANARMKRDLEAAARLQQSLLPTSLPEVPRAKFAWNFRPCDELAGDFLNVFQLDGEHVGVYVADVSGHGVAASLLSVTISRVLTPQLSMSSLLVQPDDGPNGQRIVPPAEVATELNKRFPMEESGNKYFTIAYGILNTETCEFRYVSAGHPPIIRLSPHGEAELLVVPGTPIGWFPEADYEERRMQLQAGDRLCIYSDGLPEAMNAESEQFGEKRLLQALAEGSSQDLEERLAGVVRKVEDWCSTEGPDDDVSILAFEIQ